MSDVTDTMYDNDDLLSLLTSNEEIKVEDLSSKEENTNMVSLEDKNLEEQEIDEKFKELREIAKSVEVVEESQGSGDIDDDLMNWFNGSDKLPSKPLGSYISNSDIKINAGLRRTALSNKTIQTKLKRFLIESIDTLFDANTTINLPPSEFMELYKVAFASYKELCEFERKVDKDIKDYKIRSNGDNADEIDNLKMLLSTIPHDKLKNVLIEIQKG